MEWKVFFARAAGKYHLDCDAPCEDAGHFALGNGTWVGVVCDGAGSAREARLGSELFSQWLCEGLGRLVLRRDPASTAPEPMRDQLIGLIEQTRERVAEVAHARECELREFACTLIACVVHGDKACFMHIGDGFAICQSKSGASFLSLPENGEFSDETYFVTDDAWRERLRITPCFDVEPGCVIGLMSDGASPFAVDRSRSGFFRPFLDPVVSFLRTAAPGDGDRALQDLLASERTHEITSDDKAILLAIAG
jgi:hypothetical protein